MKSLLNTDINFQINNTDTVYIPDRWHLSEIKSYFDRNGYPATVLSDCAKFYNLEQINWLGCHTVATRYLQDYKTMSFSNRFVTKYTCNLFVNKKQISRFLTLKLAEYFKLPINYIWSGIGRNEDLSSILEELQSCPGVLSPNTKDYLLTMLQLKKRWINDSHEIDDQCTADNVFQLSHGGDNVYTWHTFFKDLAEPSAVSLITENINSEHANVITWKTVFSIFACTFPIWPGGYKIADEVAKSGLDVFDDIIDHSYQYKNTLIERCWYAFNDNLHLLSDVEFAARVRKEQMHRLLENRNKILCGKWYFHIINEIDSWPDVSNDDKTAFKELTLHKFNASPV